MKTKCRALFADIQTLGLVEEVQEESNKPSSLEKSKAKKAAKE